MSIMSTVSICTDLHGPQRAQLRLDGGSDPAVQLHDQSLGLLAHRFVLVLHDGGDYFHQRFQRQDLLAEGAAAQVRLLVTSHTDTGSCSDLSH